MAQEDEHGADEHHRAECLESDREYGVGARGWCRGAVPEWLSPQVGEHQLSLRYSPGESDSGLFGGNSNWRGPVWLPVNVLLVDAMRTYAHGPGNELEVELPTGSGQQRNLSQAADDLSERLIGLFRTGSDGRRPSQPHDHPDDPLWNVHPTFSEYFHGDTGEGLGASHQTGWTSLVAHVICTPRAL
jgi:hypothetical protein